MTHFVRRWTSALALLCLAVPASSQAGSSAERVSLDVPGADKYGNQVTGELRIPDSNRQRLPAVIIINSSPGFDGRGTFYAEALNEAGIASFEIDMFQGRGLPLSPVQNLPHAFQSLRYMARHPRIDAARVGIMGFSWGGQVTLLASSERLSSEFSEGGLRFAAHLALYPQCWVLRTARGGRDLFLKRPIFDTVTGRPVHILAGDRDGYDGPDGCRLFVEWLPAASRPYYDVTIYEGATFSWDARSGGTVYEREARRGKGGMVDIVADAERARVSRDFTVGYFVRHLNRE